MADPPLHHGISAEESHLEDSGIFDRVSFEGAGLPHGSVAEVLNHLDIIVLNQTVEACLSAAAVLRYASRSCCLVFARRDNLVDIDVSTWTGSKSVLLVGMEQAASDSWRGDAFFSRLRAKGHNLLGFCDAHPDGYWERSLRVLGLSSANLLFGNSEKGESTGRVLLRALAGGADDHVSTLCEAAHAATRGTLCGAALALWKALKWGGRFDAELAEYVVRHFATSLVPDERISKWIRQNSRESVLGSFGGSNTETQRENLGYGIALIRTQNSDVDRRVALRDALRDGFDRLIVPGEGRDIVAQQERVIEDPVSIRWTMRNMQFGRLLRRLLMHAQVPFANSPVRLVVGARDLGFCIDLIKLVEGRSNTKSCKLAEQMCHNRAAVLGPAFGESCLRADIERVLGYRFGNIDLLQRALTRPINGVPFSENNENLEFLGDRVVHYCVLLGLIREFPRAPKSNLSSSVFHIVSTRSLGTAFIERGIGYMLRRKTPGSKPNKKDADLIEALMGAVYCDGGICSADQVVYLLLGEQYRTSKSRRMLKSVFTEGTASQRTLARLSEVERSTGCQFSKPTVVEAVLHGGALRDRYDEYQQLAFLGGSALRLSAAEVCNQILDAETPGVLDAAHSLLTSPAELMKVLDDDCFNFFEDSSATMPHRWISRRLALLGAMCKDGQDEQAFTILRRLYHEYLFIEHP